MQKRIMTIIPLFSGNHSNYNNFSLLKGAQVIRSSKWNKDSQRYKFTEYLGKKVEKKIIYNV